MSCICGSDVHMVRGKHAGPTVVGSAFAPLTLWLVRLHCAVQCHAGRTSLPGGYMVLGHEITGEVIEVGRDVETLKKVASMVQMPASTVCVWTCACSRGVSLRACSVGQVRQECAWV